MNNGMYNIFKKEETMNKRYKIKLQIMNISKAIFPILIFMVFLVQAFCDNEIVIKIINSENCNFNIDSSIRQSSEGNNYILTFIDNAN